MCRCKGVKNTITFILVVVMTFSAAILSPVKVSAAAYSGDYRYWSQGSSDYIGMREVGCLITAQAKMLYEADINRSPEFNPDWWYNYLLSTGGIASSSNLNMRDHAAPAKYAASIGKSLTYLGNWSASDDQLWFNINAGYYTIINLGGHFVMIDNNTSKAKGQLYIYDSFAGSASNNYFTTYNPGPRPLSVYSSRISGLVYKAHTHSYSSTITKEPTCTQAGERKYTCSCGHSYTETINAPGHKYESKVVPPTETEKGYTLHTCSVCNESYKDNYVDPPVKGEDGWYYCEELPQGVSSQNHVIQYNNHYEKVQQTSPGSDWTNAGIAKSEWQNSGGQYKSYYDLPTSDSRVLVYSCYFHFCGPNTGNVANYEIYGGYVHYDAVKADTVTSQYLADDNGHPYYYIYDSNGNKVWCKSGVTCDGAWGNHGARCCAWYKENTYQDRVKVDFYKFTKESGWVSEADANAASSSIRYKSASDVKYLIGDVNGNNKVDISDATMIQSYLAGIKELTPIQMKLADADCDSKIAINDATEIQRYLAGIANNSNIGTEISYQ